MKVAFSRKGLESPNGGMPSPIFPDGTALSLPIPRKRSPTRFRPAPCRRNVLQSQQKDGSIPVSGVFLQRDLEVGASAVRMAEEFEMVFFKWDRRFHQVRSFCRLRELVGALGRRTCAVTGNQRDRIVVIHPFRIAGCVSATCVSKGLARGKLRREHLLQHRKDLQRRPVANLSKATDQA